jgi:hypothetical protein
MNPRELFEMIDGVLARYQSQISYVLIEGDDEREKQLKKIARQLKQPMDLVKERHGPAFDVLGREIMLSYVTSYRCPDLPGLGGSHPIVFTDERRSPVMYVSAKTCSTCDYLRPARMGSKKKCALWPEERARWNASKLS